MTNYDKELDDILADFEVWAHDYSSENGQTRTQIQPQKAKAQLKALLHRIEVEVRIEELERYKTNYSENPAHDWNYINHRITELTKLRGNDA